MCGPEFTIKRIQNSSKVLSIYIKWLWIRNS